MSNFQFLEPEFSKLALTAKEAEKLVYISLKTIRYKATEQIFHPIM